MHINPLFKLTSLSALIIPSLVSAQEVASSHLPSVEVRAKSIASTSRINSKKLDETTHLSTKEVLFNEPAVSFGGGNGSSQWVMIRGMGQDQIDVKVDNAYSDSQMFHHNGRFILDPSLIKVIEVQKGTGSASAGIGATSGGIVAKTLDARDLLTDEKNVGFKINAGWNSNKGYSRGGAIFGRYKGFDALIAGNWIHQDDYKAGHGYIPASQVIKSIIAVWDSVVY